MRWTFAGLLVLAFASAASGQVVLAGLEAGTSWEWQAPTAPNQNFLHSASGSPTVFLAFPLDNDTLLRLQASDLPHEPVINGEGWPGRLRAYTVGVDYLFTNPLGHASISGGIGAYRLRLQAKHPPAGVEQSKFGWYAGVGEWFRLTRRTQVVAELTMHHASHPDTPTIVAFTAGLALSF
jgi:hypothetical protein